jgi:hypothetical protein
MISPFCEQAVESALSHGKALLKFISPNDAGRTGGHQSGFYLPKAAWEMYSPHPPEPGSNEKHAVKILWQNGLVTDSVVTWYGTKTRSEYRLTRFGRDFPYLNSDAVGNLLVLIPRSQTDFLAYVLDLDEDIDDFQAALGVEVIDTWGVYQGGREQIESEDDCLERHFRTFALAIAAFPPGQLFSEKTRDALVDCIKNFLALPSDQKLVLSIETEYRLFRLVERQLCQTEICRVFPSIDEFLRTAATIMNRRKARAGRSFENHVEFLFRDAGIPFEMRPDIDGEPDIVIPGKAAYDDPNYPTEKIFVVGLKTTCKDRWRQVLDEGKRVPQKHLLTLQRGISSPQLAAMQRAHVQLVVPRSFHRDYPSDSPLALLDVDGFIELIKSRVA